MTKPLLLAITGRPGVGKTTIAQALALQLGWPVVSAMRVWQGTCTAAREHVCRISTSMRRFSL